MLDKEQFDRLQSKIDVRFNNSDLLLTAFIHRSYLNESPSLNLPSNERLEFLGDACLELIISEYLYHTYPQSPEGELTGFRSAVVNTHSLAETARMLNLGEYLLLSRGEETSGGRDSEYLLANTFEALLGAIYLDQGYDQASSFIKRHLIPKIEAIVKNQAYKDDKSRLQEIAQEKINITPRYEVLKDWGPDHDKTFKVGVFVGKRMVGVGEGNSKQKAELVAASNALENWKYG